MITTTSEIFQSGGSDFIKFEITIERQPLYFTFNIGLPILLLGVLNGFVFLLPAESGERVGTYNAESMYLVNNVLFPRLKSGQ